MMTDTVKAALRIAHTIKMEDWDSAKDVLFAVVGALRQEGFPPETLKLWFEKSLYEDQGLKYIEKAEREDQFEACLPADLAPFRDRKGDLDCCQCGNDAGPWPEVDPNGEFWCRPCFAEAMRMDDDHLPDVNNGDDWRGFPSQNALRASRHPVRPKAA